MIIEKGTVKVVWITKNTKRIHSRMFDNLKDAEKFGITTPWFLQMVEVE